MSTTIDVTLLENLPKDSLYIEETHYRILSFIEPEVLNTLLTDGVVHGVVCGKRNDKTAFYRDEFNKIGVDLNKGNYPFYGYYSIESSRPYTAPVNLDALLSSWGFIMGYMRLYKHHIIELNVPKDIALLGKIEGLHVFDERDLFKRSDRFKSYSFECVFPYIKKEWLVSVISKQPLKACYEEATLTPLYSTNTSILKNPVRVSGSCEELPADYGNDWIYDHNYSKMFNLSRMGKEAYIANCKEDLHGEFNYMTYDIIEEYNSKLYREKLNKEV